MLIAPFGIVVGIMKILEPVYYPPDDIRNTIEFRLVFYGLMIALFVVVFVASARYKIGDRRRGG
jgi:hypothetical protein